MQMSLKPMILMGLCCTECGQLLTKPEECATTTEIVNEGVGCGAIKPENVTSRQCPKCHQAILEEGK